VPHVSAVCCARERQHPELDSETKYHLRNRLVVVQGWPMSEPAVRCCGVGKIWAARADRAHEALRGIELTVDAGEFVVVLGPSGCGKSTLLYLIAGLEQPAAGEITAHGVAVTGPAPDRSMIFQETSLFPWLSVWDSPD
jgi:NitT/TauT family transport system ATP-binding protein